jgi:non-homologous end joining protein Ku
MRDPYYLVPDGEVGQQAFAVIREAIRKEGMVALGRVVFTNREHIIAIEPRDKGMMRWSNGVFGAILRNNLGPTVSTDVRLFT